MHRPGSKFSFPTGTLLQSPAAQAALLDLHGTLKFHELWRSLQRLFETIVPHDTLVMSVNYLDWRQESSKCRLSSANSRQPHRPEIDRMVAEEGRAFFQPFLEAREGIPAYRHSQIQADPRRSGYYRKAMLPYDWRFSAHLLFWRNASVDTSFALRRRADQGDFTESEMGALHGLHPHLATAFARIRRFEEEGQRRRLLEAFYRGRPGAALILDWGLKLLYASEDALGLCAAWNFGSRQARAQRSQAAFQVPAEIRVACDELRASAGSPAELIRRVPFAAAGVEALVALRAERRGALTRPLFEIRLQPIERLQVLKDDDDSATVATTAERPLDRLSPGERELAVLVCRGLSNKEIASVLGKTEGTVKVQLSGVFHKLRVSSRAKLMVALQ